MRYYLALVNAI